MCQSKPVQTELRIEVRLTKTRRLLVVDVCWGMIDNSSGMWPCSNLTVLWQMVPHPAFMHILEALLGPKELKCREGSEWWKGCK